jgi:hypothetical protein
VRGALRRGQLHYAREAVTRGEEGSHRCGAVVTADDAQAQRKMAPATAWTLVELELRPWRLKMTLCSAAVTSGPAGRGKGGEDSSSAAALSFGVRWCGTVLDDGDVVDGCRRELSAAVTHRGLDSAGGKKIGKGGRSNGGQHWARSRGDSGTTAAEPGGWRRTLLCRAGKKEREVTRRQVGPVGSGKGETDADGWVRPKRKPKI